MIRIIIAEDHHLVRQGIKAILEKEADIEVVGEAADGQEAVLLVERLMPDVILMDIAMPRLNGIQAMQKILASGSAVQTVMLSMYSDLAMVRQALQNGARGYLIKRSVTAELLLAIRAAARGEVFLSSAISEVLVNYLMKPTEVAAVNELDLLSSRELEVLQLVAEGNTNNEIAQKMTVSAKTVEKHRASIMTKLGIHDTAGLVRIAIKHRIIAID